MFILYHKLIDLYYFYRIFLNTVLLKLIIYYFKIYILLNTQSNFYMFIMRYT